MADRPNVLLFLVDQLVASPVHNYVLSWYRSARKELGGSMKSAQSFEVCLGMDPQQAIESLKVVSHSFPNWFWPHRSCPGEVVVETRI